ncbi:MAG: hypothetical protein ACPKPY_03015 [Nitrososphaeraceae archaeon]
MEEPPKEIEPKSTQGFSVSQEDGATQYYFQVRYGVVSNSEIIGVVFFGSDWNSLSCEPVGEGQL